MGFVDEVLQPGVELTGRTPVANVVGVSDSGWCTPDGGGSRSLFTSDCGFESVLGWREERRPVERVQAALDAWRVVGWAYPRSGWLDDLGVPFDGYVEMLRSLGSRYSVAMPAESRLSMVRDQVRDPHVLEVVLRVELLSMFVESGSGSAGGGPWEAAANGMLSVFAPRYGAGLLRVHSGDLVLAPGVSAWDLAMFGVWRWGSRAKTCLLCGGRYVRQFDGGEGFARSSSMYCSRRCAMAVASREYRRRRNEPAEVVE